MIPERPADDDRTVFCRTCEAWQHPRSSCGRDESHETIPQSVVALLRHGPSAGESLGGGHFNPEARRDHPIAKFNPSSKRSGVLGGTQAIYYLTDEHDPETVLDVWIDRNVDRLAANDVSTENLTRAIGSDAFDTAWRRLKEDREFDALATPDSGRRGTQGSQTAECPYCGETVGELPGHLRREH